MVITAVQEKLEQALEEAHAICSKDGASSPACAASWDIVEELHAALAHQRAGANQVSSLDRFCEDHPDSLECRLYDI